MQLAPGPFNLSALDFTTPPLEPSTLKTAALARDAELADTDTSIQADLQIAADAFANVTDDGADADMQEMSLRLQLDVAGFDDATPQQISVNVPEVDRQMAAADTLLPPEAVQPAPGTYPEFDPGQTYTLVPNPVDGEPPIQNYDAAVATWNLTRPELRDEFYVGDVWHIRVAGPPNKPVTVRATHDGNEYQPIFYGYTGPAVANSDNIGTLDLEGIEDTASVGYWTMRVLVGDIVAFPVLNFRVHPALEAPALTHGPGPQLQPPGAAPPGLTVPAVQLVNRTRIGDPAFRQGDVWWLQVQTSPNKHVGYISYWNGRVFDNLDNPAVRSDADGKVIFGGAFNGGYAGAWQFRVFVEGSQIGQPLDVTVI